MIITDINDHNPVIEQTDPVRVSVVEHTPIGFLVTFISAVDIFDYDTNAQIVYNITSGNSDSKLTSYWIYMYIYIYKVIKMSYWICSTILLYPWACCSVTNVLTYK